MKKNKGGRPTLRSPEKVKKLEEAFALDCTIKEACFYADISIQTYYDWLLKKPELVERFEALRQKPVLTARTTLVKSLSTDVEMALKYLERKRKAEFSTRSELTGEDGTKLIDTVKITIHEPKHRGVTDISTKPSSD